MSSSTAKVFETSPASPDGSPKKEQGQSPACPTSHQPDTASAWGIHDVPSIYCSCTNCKKYYEKRPVTNIFPEPRPVSRPRYSYLHFVNHMREAAARREEERMAKRDIAQKAAMRREAEKARLLANRERESLRRKHDHQDKRRKL
ncbi:hypothetical protein HW555_002247 [Spodoptera exigua]|uniref:Uncharacterized protein n=1 Tax=Spodoptera exigua TaxID=7107 RepID=A0A835GSN5_SPOEX|nr:hypothetical protein HW555_002247 [Spodoptera exigua]KAH9642403.1 hypothetical protein HF086_004935 [Spodoptera exigua]